MLFDLLFLNNAYYRWIQIWFIGINYEIHCLLRIIDIYISKNETI
jgi:hypothetical protein